MASNIRSSRAKFNKRQETEDTSKVHSQLMKQARKSGQLNLSGRSMSTVPDSVWRVNLDLPIESKTALLDGGDDAWWEQMDLTKLILASNQLIEIPDNVNLLPALTVLDVHDNRIEMISDAIGELVELQRLILSHNKLTLLPSVLGKLTKIVTLQVENNNLTEICDEIGNLINLEDLNVSKNQISHLPPSFDWLRRLTKLDVSQNNITELPHEIGSLTNLKLLDASQNKIASVPESFGNLSKLVQLYLQQNRLAGIPHLARCTSLKDVQLGNNCIEVMNGELLLTFVSVSILDLRDNKISVVPDEIGSLQSIERLTLSNNNLSSLPCSLGMLPLLKSLQLEGNPLRSIRRDIIMRGTDEVKKYLRSRMTEPEQRQQEVVKQSQNAAEAPPTVPDTVDLNQHEIRNLKSFNYSGRQATCVPDNVWSEVATSAVTTVNLSKNRLTDLPQGLKVLSESIKDLNIGYNKLETLHPDIASFHHLVALDLRNNCLVDLPLSVAALKNLREIILSCNRFQKLPRVLYELLNLEIIFANDNKIGVIDVDGLSRLTQLGTLNLQNNDIASVPAELGNMKWLKCLQLTGNAFRNPRAAVLAKGTSAILEYLSDKIT